MSSLIWMDEIKTCFYVCYKSLFHMVTVLLSYMPVVVIKTRKKRHYCFLFELYVFLLMETTMEEFITMSLEDGCCHHFHSCLFVYYRYNRGSLCFV